VYVVAFGCSVSELGNPRNLRIWDELAAIRDGYGLSRDAIVRRVETLFDEIASKVR
jgi:DNA-binding Lrp family transcriptional regulator